MIGIQIEGKRLRALRLAKKLSGAGLGAQTGRTVTQIYRVETGVSATSFGFLDSLVPLFGVDAVADLIINADDKEAFLNTQQMARMKALAEPERDSDAEMDAWLDRMLADLPPITDEQRRKAVALLLQPDRDRRKA